VLAQVALIFIKIFFKAKGFIYGGIIFLRAKQADRVVADRCLPWPFTWFASLLFFLPFYAVTRALLGIIKN